MFRVVAIVMAFAPVGAFAAMAYTVGTFGVRALVPLARLMLDVYGAMLAFVFGVLGLVAWRWRFSLFALLRHIRGELLLVLGTSSSEAALPRLVERLEAFGCRREVVGLVVPAGYSFNLDGTSLYLSMAVLFIAQAFRVDLSLGQQLGVLGVLMLTSKGAAGVTGSGFVVLASTLAATRVVPVEGLALVLGVDRFMSEARAIVNLIGNAVATVVVSKSEGAFDEARYAAAVERAPLARPGDSPGGLAKRTGLAVAAREERQAEVQPHAGRVGVEAVAEVGLGAERDVAAVRDLDAEAGAHVRVVQVVALAAHDRAVDADERPDVRHRLAVGHVRDQARRAEVVQRAELSVVAGAGVLVLDLDGREAEGGLDRDAAVVVQEEAEPRPLGGEVDLDERLVAEAEREAGVGADLNRVRRLVDGDGVLGAGGRRGEDSAREGGSGNAKRTGHAISGKGRATWDGAARAAPLLQHYAGSVPPKRTRPRLTAYPRASSPPSADLDRGVPPPARP